jgi:hypothetical protein
MKASQITTVDFFDDLASPYARKRFFWGFVFFGALCAVVLLLSRNFVPAGGIRDVIDALAVEVLAGIMIVLGFYGLYMHFIGPNVGFREVTVIRPRDIRERMEALPIGSRYYVFWGRSGSYFRSVPLLTLDERARKEKVITDIDVVLPEPTDARLIKSYREILHSLGETSAENPLLPNVLATSIACAILNANNKYLRVRVFYSKFLPAFRVDMSENGAILTQDDPAKAALFFQAGSEFHEMWRTTVRNEMAVSVEVKWDEALFDGRGLDEKACDKQTLNAFGINVEDIDKLQQEVATLITKRPHRYK